MEIELQCVSRIKEQVFLNGTPDREEIDGERGRGSYRKNINREGKVRGVRREGREGRLEY